MSPMNIPNIDTPTKYSGSPNMKEEVDFSIKIKRLKMAKEHAKTVHYTKI